MFSWTIFFIREEITVDNVSLIGYRKPENVFCTWGDNISDAIDDFEVTMCMSKNQIIQIYATERK